VVRLFSAAYGGKSRGGQSRLNGKGLAMTVAVLTDSVAYKLIRRS